MLIIALLFVAAAVRSLEIQTWRAISYAIGMRRRDALLKSVVQSSTDCIVCIDDNGIIKTANPAAARLFNCAAYDLVDEPISKFITLFAGDGASARLGAMHGVIRECDARTRDGEVFPVEISLSRVRLNTERLHTAIVRDIRERRAQTRRLQHQATHDSLTSLPNRAALLAQLERGLAPDRSQPSITLLMLDLCRFKEVNDTLGHNVGDRVLCEVAHRFQQALGDRGFIARIGGDEFTVVLDQPHSAETIASTSQSLSDCLRAPIDVAGISIEVGVSIGIARFPQDASEAQTLLRHADVAMYLAKKRGSPFEYYDAALDENSVRKLAIGGELRSAIAGGQLELHFQPQVNLRTGMVDSVEALVRWFHPTQGAISPAEFVAIAEATDLIRPLTEWTLSGALSQVRAWRERGVHVRIAVNLSARLLQDTAFPAHLQKLLEQSGVSAPSLELEITESAMMLDPARALRVIQEIHKLGVLISIDDFGTGYSSLGYLRDLPVHALKLDRSFVAGHAQQHRRPHHRRVHRADGACPAPRARGRGRGNRVGCAIPRGRWIRLRAGVSLLRRAAAGQMPGLDRGVQCHRHARGRRHHRHHRAARQEQRWGCIARVLVPPPAESLTHLRRDARDPRDPDLKADVRRVVEVLQVLGDRERHQHFVEAMPNSQAELELVLQQFVEIGLLACDRRFGSHIPAG